MKKKIHEQILEKCNKFYKEQEEEKKDETEETEECRTYKECQCEQDLQEAFFGINYNLINKGLKKEGK